jgi:hypothetical protein
MAEMRRKPMQRSTWFGTVAVCAVTLVAPCLLQAGTVPAADDAAIRKVVLDYVEGWYLGDAVRMERALHPDLVKRALLRDEKTGRQYIQPTSASAMVRMTESGFGKLKQGEVMDNQIEVLDVYGDAATVRAMSTHFVDYLHLVRWQGAWKILNVLWVPRAPASKP